MLAKKIVLLLAVLALTTLACGITIDMPITTDIKTGPTVMEEILVLDPNPEADVLDVYLSFGAGELTINPGGDALIEGTAVYNVEDLRPEVKSSDGKVELSTGNLEIQGIPSFDDRMENNWDLKLSERPMDLRIVAGAYSGDIELGALNLTDLRITDGAADVRVNFDAPNQTVMDNLRYETGASSVVLTNLGNANFRSMIFQGGAGSYELDFSGDLQEDASVLVQTGLSSLTITVPDHLNVRVRVDGGLSNISTQGSWGQSGGVYTHSGEGPDLEITIEMGAGSVILETE